MTLAAALVTLAAAVAPRPAQATAVLDLERCTAAPAAEIRDIVATELRSSMVLLDAGPGATNGPPSGVTAIRVACDVGGAEIDIRDPITGKSLSRSLDLRPTPQVARAHLIALSIVELLFASWGELLTNPTPVATPAGSAAPPEARAAALSLVREQAQSTERAPADLSISVAAAMSSFGGGKGATTGPRLYGGALALAWDGPRHVGLVGDICFQRGSGEYALGSVSVDTLNGLAALVSRPSFRRVVLRAGVGARGGVAWLSGSPSDPGTAVGGAVRGVWWGPAVLAGGGARLGRRVVVELTLELGHTLLSVTARVQGETPMVIGGTWWRGTLGVGLAL